jgi:hypothetical protein
MFNRKQVIAVKTNDRIITIETAYRKGSRKKKVIVGAKNFHRSKAVKMVAAKEASKANRY